MHICNPSFKIRATIAFMPLLFVTSHKFILKVGRYLLPRLIYTLFIICSGCASPVRVIRTDQNVADTAASTTITATRSDSWIGALNQVFIFLKTAGPTNYSTHFICAPKRYIMFDSKRQPNMLVDDQGGYIILSSTAYNSLKSISLIVPYIIVIVDGKVSRDADIKPIINLLHVPLYKKLDMGWAGLPQKAYTQISDLDKSHIKGFFYPVNYDKTTFYNGSSGLVLRPEFLNDKKNIPGIIDVTWKNIKTFDYGQELDIFNGHYLNLNGGVFDKEILIKYRMPPDHEIKPIFKKIEFYQGMMSVDVSREFFEKNLCVESFYGVAVGFLSRGDKITFTIPPGQYTLESTMVEDGYPWLPWLVGDYARWQPGKLATGPSVDNMEKQIYYAYRQSEPQIINARRGMHLNYLFYISTEALGAHLHVKALPN